jgi:hypothetical protein
LTSDSEFKRFAFCSKHRESSVKGFYSTPVDTSQGYIPPHPAPAQQDGMKKR